MNSSESPFKIEQITAKLPFFRRKNGATARVAPFYSQLQLTYLSNCDLSLRTDGHAFAQSPFDSTAAAMRASLLWWLVK